MNITIPYQIHDSVSRLNILSSCSAHSSKRNREVQEFQCSREQRDIQRYGNRGMLGFEGFKRAARQDMKPYTVDMTRLSSVVGTERRIERERQCFESMIA